MTGISDKTNWVFAVKLENRIKGNLMHPHFSTNSDQEHSKKGFLWALHVMHFAFARKLECNYFATDLRQIKQATHFILAW